VADFDNGLFDRPDMARFYDSAHTSDDLNKPRADFDYCANLAEGARSILDLGCGTGELIARLADGRRVAGVDPASAMLNIARERRGSDAVNWVVGDGRDVRIGERFDLVVLTGHAFLVFLSEADRARVLTTIAVHLSPEGRFIFDSRNPHYPAAKSQRRHVSSRRFEQSEMGEIESWNVSEYDEAAGILSYENGYRVSSTGEEFSAPAKIRYTPQPGLAREIEAAGLVVEAWLGDWDGTLFEPLSREIIRAIGLKRG
jgi:SAM-dependent methyltransferase